MPATLVYKSNRDAIWFSGVIAPYSKPDSLRCYDKRVRLNAGSRLGSYEILAPLGAGGMGEVYRGRDVRLGREVALKILPSAFSSNADRLTRFEQEARSASALNHPNIITIYEIGVVDSSSFISMEYVDGKTLREALQAGPLPARKAIQLAAQVAEGLAKAHEAGIIHRDLKPENLMITADGYVKILDFGLAKLMTPSANEQVSSLPTAAKTDAGVLMGTVGYMSPEQASGSAIDFRSDQFSLGVILYEMVTAKRAFLKKTTVETLAAIINEEPEPVQSINSHIAAPIRWLIERCIEKNPNDRYASTRDLARDIQSIRDHYSEVASTSESALDVVQPIQKKRKLHKIFDVVAIALIFILGAFLFFAMRDQPKTKTKPVSYHRLTYRRGPIASAKFSRDGQMIVYSAKWEGRAKDLYLSRPDAVEARSLGIQNTDILSISPAGEMLLIDRKAGGLSPGLLSQVNLSGGSPRPIENNVTGACWNPDGSQFAVSKYSNGKYRLEYPSGKVIHESANAIDRIEISPEANSIAFILHPSFASNGHVLIVDLQGKVINDSGKYYPTGLSWHGSNEVWFTSAAVEAGGGSEMHALDLHGSKRQLGTFTSAILKDISGDGRILMDFADTRAIAMAQRLSQPGEKGLTWLDNSEVKDISSDGTKVLIHERGDGSDTPAGTIYVANMDGSPGTRLAPGAAREFSPDEKFVLAEVGSDIILVPTGTGTVKTFKASDKTELTAHGFFPDNKHLLMSSRTGAGLPEFYSMDFSGNKHRLPIEALDDVVLISPDGDSILLSRDQALQIYSLSTGKSKPFNGIDSNERPLRWSQDGKWIFVRNISGTPVKVFKVEVSSGKRSLFKEITVSDPAGFVAFTSIVISDDEQAFAYSYRRGLSTLFLIENFSAN